MDSMLTLEKLKEKAQFSRIAATNLRTLDIFDCFKLFRSYYNAGKSTKELLNDDANAFILLSRAFCIYLAIKDKGDSRFYQIAKDENFHAMLSETIKIMEGVAASFSSENRGSSKEIARDYRYNRQGRKGPGTVSLSSVSVYSLSTAPSKTKATNLYGQPPSLSNLTTAPAPSLRRTQSKSNHPPISYSPFVMMKKSDQEEDQEFSSPSPLTFDETVTIDCDRNSNSALSEATFVSSFHGKTKSKAFNFIGDVKSEAIKMENELEKEPLTIYLSGSEGAETRLNLSDVSLNFMRDVKSEAKKMENELEKEPLTIYLSGSEGAETRLNLSDVSLNFMSDSDNNDDVTSNSVGHKQHCSCLDLYDNNGEIGTCSDDAAATVSLSADIESSNDDDIDVQSKNDRLMDEANSCFLTDDELF